MGNDSRPGGEQARSQLQRGLNFLLKRTTGLYFRDIISNQQEILRRQEELSDQLRALAGPPASRQAIYLGDHKVLTRTAYGHKIVMDARDKSLFPHIALDGLWEPWIASVFEAAIRPGMTVVDAGANVGYFTLLACERVGPGGRVLAFEPDPNLFAMLFTSVEINGFFNRCSSAQMALSQSSGTATFHRYAEHLGGNTLWHTPGVDEALLDRKETIEVQTIAFDDFIVERNLPDHINVVKIDTEGSEALILQGMKKTLTCNSSIVLICEFCPGRIRLAGCDPEATLDFLVELGFPLRIIGQDASIAPISRESLLSIDGEVMLYLKRTQV